MRITVGDVVLNCEVAGEGTPLVLTHGLGNDLHFWDDCFDSLAEHHRVVRWDVRGFGHSDKPPGPYSLSMFAGDLAGLLDGIGVDRVHLLGISMGGAIAQRFALDFPGRLRSLILVSTSSEVGQRATTNWRRLADIVERDGFGPGVGDASRSFSPGFAERCPDIVRDAGQQTCDNDHLAYAAAARAVSEYDWTADLAGVCTPTLILQGLEDFLTPPGGSVKMSRALPAARLLLIPETGHNLPIEQPLMFRSAVLAFTAGVDTHLETLAAKVGV